MSLQSVQVGKLNPVQHFLSLFQGLGELKESTQSSYKEQSHTPSYSQRIPIPLMNPVKAELKYMEMLGVTLRIESMNQLIKLNDQVCISVDLTHLNDSVHRERYSIQAVD